MPAVNKGAGEAAWVTKNLGDICDFEGGSQPPKSQFIHEKKPGYIRCLQIRDFANDKNVTFIPESKKNRRCEQNDILIGRYGASVGKILTGKAGAYIADAWADLGRPEEVGYMFAGFQKYLYQQWA